MSRSYFFALLTCFLFSLAALINGYHNLPTVSASPEAYQEVPIPSAPEENKPRDLTDNQDETATYESGKGKLACTTTSPALEAAAGEKLVDYSSFPRKQLQTSTNSLSSNLALLNKRSNNFNILLLGVDGNKLEMVCVYSINHHLKTQLKSVSLFFPTNSLLLYKGKKTTLVSIFSSGDWKAVAEAVESEMYIDINYYVKIDRQALRDLEKNFEPIYVDGKRVQMETLFVRRTSNEDDRLIARILKQVLRPEMFFKYIPGLVFGIHGDIESNFSFTPRNLAFYYRIAKKLSTNRIEKVVLLGTTQWKNGRKVNIPPEDLMGSAIYRETKP